MDQVGGRRGDGVDQLQPTLQQERAGGLGDQVWRAGDQSSSERPERPLGHLAHRLQQPKAVWRIRVDIIFPAILIWVLFLYPRRVNSDPDPNYRPCLEGVHQYMIRRSG